MVERGESADGGRVRRSLRDPGGAVTERVATRSLHSFVAMHPPLVVLFTFAGTALYLYLDR